MTSLNADHTNKAHNQPLTFHEYLARNAKNDADGIALRFQAQGTETPSWQTLSWKNLYQNALCVSHGLAQLGLHQQRGLAIMAPNSEKWEVLFYACLFNNSFAVGVDMHLPAEQKNYILEHSQAEILAAHKVEDLQHLSKKVLAQFKAIIILDTAVTPPAPYFTYSSLLKNQILSKPAPIESSAATAVVVYSSGTTGTPKGVSYTQKQILETAYNLIPQFHNPKAGHRFIAWLPVANLFQRMINVWALVTVSPLSIVANPMDVMNALKDVKPTIFIGVPRFFERIADEVLGKLAKCPSWTRPIVRLLIKGKIKHLFGGNLQYLISGSAPLRPAVLALFQSFDMPILEAYGVSESVLPIAMNFPHAYKLGSVGRIVPGNTVKLSEENEVLLKGPCVISHYFRSEDRSRWTTDGFFRTGDFGTMDENGFLTLSGRADDLVKTSNGRKVSLLKIEAQFKNISDIDQMVIVGHGRKHLLAVVTLKNASSHAQLESLRQAIASVNTHLPQHEQVRGVLILSAPFSVAAGHLTANLKIRRAAIEQKYAAALDQIEKETSSSQLVLVHEEQLQKQSATSANAASGPLIAF